MRSAVTIFVAACLLLCRNEVEAVSHEIHRTTDAGSAEASGDEDELREDEVDEEAGDDDEHELGSSFSMMRKERSDGDVVAGQSEGVVGGGIELANEDRLSLDDDDDEQDVIDSFNKRKDASFAEGRGGRLKQKGSSNLDHSLVRKGSPRRRIITWFYPRRRFRRRRSRRRRTRRRRTRRRRMRRRAPPTPPPTPLPGNRRRVAPAPQGSKGWRGRRGRKGLAGSPGAAGLLGPVGPQGPPGPAGPPGATGREGDRGDEGDTGDPGTPATATLSVDCKWGHWSEWEPCTRTCAGGFRRRERMVETAPTGGGKDCDGKDYEHGQCVPLRTEECPINPTPPPTAAPPPQVRRQLEQEKRELKGLMKRGPNGEVGGWLSSPDDAEDVSAGPGIPANIFSKWPNSLPVPNNNVDANSGPNSNADSNGNNDNNNDNSKSGDDTNGDANGGSSDSSSSSSDSGSGGKDSSSSSSSSSDAAADSSSSSKDSSKDSAGGGDAAAADGAGDDQAAGSGQAS